MTVDARTTERPARGGLAAAYALSITLACGAIAVSIFGLLGPNAELAQPPSVLVSRAGDLANLLVLVPALLVTSRLARRGSFLGLLLWPGALFYAVYINAVYLLTAPFAVLVFGYLGLVVLAAATVIALLCDIDGAVVRRRLTAAPAQMTGTVLVALAALTYAGLMAQAADLLGSGTTPAVRAQWAIDASLGTPPLLLTGLLLLRRKPLGFAAAAGALFVSVIGGVAFGVAGLLDTTLGGPGTDEWVIVVHLTVSTIAVLTLARFVRASRGGAHNRRAT